MTEENMHTFRSMHTLRLAFICAFAGALMACNVASLYAAPLPTNVAAMKSMVVDSSIPVRWGGWRGGGWGYRGWGWGAGALAGALIGGAIASSAYGYDGGPYYGGYYPGYSYYPAYYGPYYGPWATQEPGAFSFYRPYGYGWRPWGYW
jgi:hypothetical protein